MSSSLACRPLRMRRLLRDTPPASSRSSLGPSPATASSWAASLAAAALPSSMVLAISTSSSAFSSGTRPISLRYVCTGSSALPLDSAETARRVAVGSRRAGAAPFESLRRPGRLARRGELRVQLLDLVLVDEHDALGGDAVDQRRQHLGRELHGVQRLDQLVLRELSLLASGRERGVEVDLRHAVGERDVRDGRQRPVRRRPWIPVRRGPVRRSRGRIGGRVETLVVDGDCRILAHCRPAKSITPLDPSRPTTLPTGRRHRARSPFRRVRPASGAPARSRPPRPATSRPRP